MRVEIWRRIVAKRLLATIFTLLWVFIVGTWTYVNLTYLQESCEKPNVHGDFHIDNVIPEQINPKLPKFEMFRLNEYRPRNQALRTPAQRRKSKDDEIPILYIPDLGDGWPQVLLSRMLFQRTADSHFKFNYFTIDFNNYVGVKYGLLLERQSEFIELSIRALMNMYPRVRPIILGHYMGGVMGLSVLSKWPKHEMRTTKLTDLLIVESSPIGATGFYLDYGYKEYYEWMWSNWTLINQRRIGNIGLVSFSGGAKDTTTPDELTKLKDTVHVPTWTIDGVPDGINEGEMQKCGPLITQVADLLMEYGRAHKQKSGKEIVEDFYRDEERRKWQHLPAEWRDDVLEEAIQVEVGGAYEFQKEGKQWLTVKLEHGEFIWINVTAKCLKSVTLIRQVQHIRRKFPGEHYSVQFNIFSGRRFENIRMLVELDGNCSVTIGTNSKWMVYPWKIYNDANNHVHYLMVGAPAAAGFLVIIEGQKRSEKIEKQIVMFIALIAATVYYMTWSLANWCGAFLVGVSSLVVIFLQTSVADWTVTVLFKKPMDLAWLSLPVSEAKWIPLFFVVCTFIFSPTGYMLTYLMLIFVARPVLELPIATSMFLAVFKTSAFNHYMQLRGFETVVFGFTTALFLYFALSFIFKRVTRFWMHLIGAGMLLCHVALPDMSLEHHYTILYILLTLNAFAVQMVPKMIRERKGNVEELEQEYEEMEQLEDIIEDNKDGKMKRR